MQFLDCQKDKIFGLKLYFFFISGQSALPHFLNGGSSNELATESTSNIEDSNNISDQVLDKSVSNKCKTCDFKIDNTVDFQNHLCNTCSICGKHYNGKNGKYNLRRHIKIVHEKVRIQCDFCGKNYADNNYRRLKMHIKMEHPNENLVDRKRSRSRSKNENVMNSKVLEIKKEQIENISESAPLEDVKIISQNDFQTEPNHKLYDILLLLISNKYSDNHPL